MFQILDLSFIKKETEATINQLQEKCIHDAQSCILQPFIWVSFYKNTSLFIQADTFLDTLSLACVKIVKAPQP